MTNDLHACINTHLEHARQVCAVDEELGTHHGLSWSNFVLLMMLSEGGEATPTWKLAGTLNVYVPLDV